MKYMDETILGARLLAVSEFVRDGAVLCDVGTDHAKLPIFLTQKNCIKKAYATDINAGPIACAASNVRDLGLGEVVECIRTDGLRGTEGLGITDVSICGMGGELIVRILSECGYIRNQDINLILQPMSHTEDVRRYLFDFGFDIRDERLVRETGKLYTVINAVYSGASVPYSDVDLVLGKVLPKKDRDELFSEMVDRALYHLENKMKSTDEAAVAEAKALYGKITASAKSTK